MGSPTTLRIHPRIVWCKDPNAKRKDGWTALGIAAWLDSLVGPAAIFFGSWKHLSILSIVIR